MLLFWRSTEAEANKARRRRTSHLQAEAGADVIESQPIGGQRAGLVGADDVDAAIASTALSRCTMAPRRPMKIAPSVNDTVAVSTMPCGTSDVIVAAIISTRLSVSISSGGGAG